MAKVCSVKGTTVGMLIQEHIAIKTAPNAIYTKSIVRMLFLILFVLFIIPPRTAAKLKPLTAAANIIKLFGFKNPFPSLACSRFPQNLLAVGNVTNLENRAVHITHFFE